MNTNQNPKTSFYSIHYTINTDIDPKLRHCVVNITEGYSTEADIPKILAVKHYSNNRPETIERIYIVSSVQVHR